MINNKRIQRLKHNIKKTYGSKEFSKVAVRAKEGIFLFNLLEKPGSDERRVKIDKEIINYDVAEFIDHSIDKILVVGDGRSQPVIIIDDIPEDDDFQELKQYADENNILNYSELSTDDLKKLADLE